MLGRPPQAQRFWRHPMLRRTAATTMVAEVMRCLLLRAPLSPTPMPPPRVEADRARYVVAGSCRFLTADTGPGPGVLNVDITRQGGRGLGNPFVAPWGAGGPNEDYLSNVCAAHAERLRRGDVPTREVVGVAGGRGPRST